MKKTTLIILLALVLALGAVGFAGCDLDGLSGKVTPGEFETDEQVFGFSAASAATVISAMNGGSASEAALALAPMSEVTDEEVLAELNDYMFLVESILADGAFGFEIVDSDLEGYAHKMTVSYKDITGAAKTSPARQSTMRCTTTKRWSAPRRSGTTAKKRPRPSTELRASCASTASTIR